MVKKNKTTGLKELVMLISQSILKLFLFYQKPEAYIYAIHQNSHGRFSNKKSTRGNINLGNFFYHWT